jgi:hypothetical protein
MGGCGSVSATGIITVTSTGTVNTTGAASTTPILCRNTPLTNITYITTGATGIGTPSGLPPGVTAAWAGNIITVSGTPTVAGIFPYSIPLTGGCGNIIATGTITVSPINTASAPSSTPTVCLNTAMTAVYHTTTGTQGIGIPSGLPPGVTAVWSVNTISITGTPTVAGTFNYSIPLIAIPIIGSCGNVSATGTITVNFNTVSAASSTPTACINEPLTNITHATTIATGIGSPSGLPAGVTANWSGNTITISGTPTVSGTFNYTIPLTGGCGTVNATGTITVTDANTVGIASSAPTLCINSALTAITHTTTGATGIGTPTGLPAGVSANFGSNSITISGTPTAAGTFSYSIPLTGGCGSVNATGSITVNTNTVGPPSSNPTVCINTPMPNVIRTTTGATGIGVPTNLPTGVTASFNTFTNVLTLSGTPTDSGTFNYSIPLTGGCGLVVATGTITVNINAAAPPSSNPSLCIDTPANFQRATTGATGIGTATGLPTGLTATWAADTITISGTPTAVGTFTYSIPLIGGCGLVNATGTITVIPSSLTATISGGATVCADVNSVLLTSSGSIDTYQWQSSTNDVVFTNIGGATSDTYTVTNINQTSYYRLVSSNGTCPAATSSSVAVTTIPRPTASLSGSTEICAGNSSSLSIALTGSGPWSGTLSNGQAFSSSVDPAIVSVNPSASTTYTVTALSDNNCQAISGLNSSATVSVRPLPTASITGSAVVCGGNSATVTINGPADGQVSFTVNGASHSAILNGSGIGTINTGNVWQNLTYELVDVYDGFCENTANGTATITYQEAPDAAISGSTQLCSGQSTSIAFSGNPNAVVTYNVNGGASQNVTLNGSGNGTINTGALTINTTYNLVSVASGGCSSIIGTSAVVNVGLNIYYQDNDGDGYGNSSVSTAACTLPVGHSAVGGDCCDSNADINPLTEWWADMDGDGYGSFVIDNGCFTGVSCSSGTWFGLIPYYPGAHSNIPYALDCNDNEVSVNPGMNEVCGNNTDDDCNGTIDIGCNSPQNDAFTNSATVTVNNPNAFYPNCQIFNGSVTNAGISAQGNPANVSVGAGRDVWYRFVAPSTGVQIKVHPVGFDAVIELRTAAHPVGQVDVENVNNTVGGLEILNSVSLVAGTTYYVGVRNFNATNTGTFTMCISPLLQSGCGLPVPVAGFSTCANYKAIYRGAATYTFNFTGTGGSAAFPFVTTVGTTTGLIPLSTPALDIRYGGIYSCRVDANYALVNGVGTQEPMTILGSTGTANCTGIQIMNQPNVEVRFSQRCPATITRSTFLIGTAVSSNTIICGATGYRYRFTKVTDCTGVTTAGLPFTSNTPGSTPFLNLTAVFPSTLPSVGYWRVEIAPIFSHGLGNYGPAQVIQVTGTSASLMLPELNEGMDADKSQSEHERPNFSNNVAGDWGPAQVIAVSGSADSQMLDDELGAQQMKTFEVHPLSVVYPNPNNGNEVNINLTDIGSGELIVKIVDAVGRTIYNKSYTVDGSLFTKINFAEQLTSGIYLVEFTINGETMNERLIVGR